MVAPDARWFFVGIGVKRWIVALAIGIVFVSLGVGYLLVTVYREAPLPEIFYWLTLQFIDRWLRGLIFIGGGAALIVLSVIQINRSLLQPFMATAGDDTLVDILYRHRALGSGPTIVCIGGGPGLSIVMRGLKNATANLWGVTLGHGPARTRSELGLLRDRVLLASTEEVAVTATTADGVKLDSETAILTRTTGEPIRSVSVRALSGLPAEANSEAVAAINQADAIVIGPGDLFASVIPALLIPDIAEAIRQSTAKKIFICNIMTQAGKTTGFTVDDHVAAIHSEANIQVDYVLVNKRRPDDKLLAAYLDKKQSEVVFDPDAPELSKVTFANSADKFTLVEGAFLVEADLTTDMQEELFFDREGRDVHRSLHVIRHDPDKLGAAIGQLIADDRWRLPAAS
jgi:2-phospho-L-lactate transferase/gluconeogenesis factor (CofD/UPF0052 family)